MAGLGVSARKRAEVAQAARPNVTAGRDLRTATVFAVGLDTLAAPAVEDMLALKVSNGPAVCGFTRLSRLTTPYPTDPCQHSPQNRLIIRGAPAYS